MEYAYDLPPEKFSEYRDRPLLWRALRSNGPVFIGGALYLLWRGEWRKCCKLYLPVLLEMAASCGVILYGTAANARVPYWAGVVGLELGLVWYMALNIYMDLFWNDTPHPRRRYTGLAVLGAGIAMAMFALCGMAGILAGNGSL